LVFPQAAKALEVVEVPGLATTMHMLIQAKVCSHWSDNAGQALDREILLGRLGYGRVSNFHSG
jgi:hypothetical protein